MPGASKIALVCMAANICLATNPGVARDLLITNARIVVDQAGKIVVDAR